MREEFIKKGVKSLREYGYPNVTEGNIITDEIYSAFFLQMLEDTMNIIPHSDIIKLITEIKNRSNP